MRNSFLDDLIFEQNSYFPSGKLSDFDIFEPSNIPGEVGIASTYGLNEVYSLSANLHWDSSFIDILARD